MRTIGILGLGRTGSLLARLLVSQGMSDRLILLDQDDARVVGLASDLAAGPSHCDLVLQDAAALRTADLLYVATGQHALTARDRFGELAVNATAVAEWAPRVRASGFAGTVINLASPNEALTGLLQRRWQLPVERVVGTGTVVDTGRLHQVLAQATKQPRTSVTGWLLGQHDGRLVPAWSTFRINGQPIDQPVAGTVVDRERALTASREAAWRALTGPSGDDYALASWALQLGRAVLTDQGAYFPVATYQPQYEGWLAYPVQLTRRGRGNFLLPTFYPLEEEQARVAAAAVRDQLAAMEELA